MLVCSPLCKPNCQTCKNARIDTVNNLLYCINSQQYPTSPCNDYNCTHQRKIPYQIDYKVWRDVEDAEFRIINDSDEISNQEKQKLNAKENDEKKDIREDNSDPTADIHNDSNIADVSSTG